jgi:hypothetical protein
LLVTLHYRRLQAQRYWSVGRRLKAAQHKLQQVRTLKPDRPIDRMDAKICNGDPMDVRWYGRNASGDLSNGDPTDISSNVPSGHLAAT